MRWLDLTEQGVRLILVEDMFRTPILAVQGARAKRQLHPTLREAGFRANDQGEWIQILDGYDLPKVGAVLQSLRLKLRGAQWNERAAPIDVMPDLSDRVRLQRANPNESAFYAQITDAAPAPRLDPSAARIDQAGVQASVADGARVAFADAGLAGGGAPADGARDADQHPEHAAANRAEVPANGQSDVVLPGESQSRGDDDRPLAQPAENDRPGGLIPVAAPEPPAPVRRPRAPRAPKVKAVEATVATPPAAEQPAAAAVAAPTVAAEPSAVVAGTAEAAAAPVEPPLTTEARVEESRQVAPPQPVAQDDAAANSQAIAPEAVAPPEAPRPSGATGLEAGAPPAVQAEPEPTAAPDSLSDELARAEAQEPELRERRVVGIAAKVAAIPEPLSLETKRAAAWQSMPLLSRLLAQKRQADAAGAAFIPDLTPDEMATLARYMGRETPETADGVFTGAAGRAAPDMATQFVLVGRAWQSSAMEDPTPEELPLYGEAAHAQRTQDINYATAVLTYHSRLSTYEATDDFCKTLWDLAIQAGFDGGKVILPNSGAGQLSRMRPEDLRIAMTQVPNEPVAFEIAKVLHPEDNVIGGLYERLVLPASYYDLAIGINHTSQHLLKSIHGDEGNPPAVIDDAINAEADTPALNQSQHMVYKALQRLRAGGLGMFVVRSDMLLTEPSTTGEAARVRIAQIGEMVSRVRLTSEIIRGLISQVENPGPPDNVNASAISQDSYDLLIMRRRPDLVDRERAKEEAERWSNMEALNVAVAPARWAGEQAYRTRYTAAMGAFRETLPFLVPAGTLLPPEGEGERLPGNDLVLADVPAAGAQPAMYEGSYVLINNGMDVGVITQDQVQAYEASARQIDILRHMIPVRDAIAEVLRVQIETTNDDSLRAEQRRLRAAYEAFVERFGPLSRTSNVEVYSDEPGLPQLLALENYDVEKDVATPTDFFSERVIGSPKLVERCETAHEALALSMGRRGFISPGLMAALTRKPWSQVRQELRNEIFMDPLEGRWVTKNQYLSGNVRAKLQSAQVAATIDPSLFNSNVEALVTVQPKNVPAEEIDFQFGAPWIPPADYRRFLIQIMGVPEDNRDKAIPVQFDRLGAKWQVDLTPELCRNADIIRWQTEHKDANSLIEATLNSKTILITEDGPEGKPVTNHVETAQAHMLQERLRDSFQRWIMESPLRASRLAALYNERVNAYREVKHDGSYLRFEQMSPLRVPMDHQRNTVARGIEDGQLLIAHAVGSGKSFTMAAIAMEAKRMGLHRKPVMTVPKATINQMAGEIIKFYPSAKVLIGDGISASNRASVRRFISRASMDNWDIVLISHESFRALPLSAKAQIELLNREISENEKEKSLTNDTFFNQRARVLGKKLERLRAQAEQQHATGDEQYGFERIGADLLIVDEAHLFKNVNVTTKMTVLGIQGGGSDRAADMQQKVAHVRGLNGGRRGIIFATATPICNSIAELYTMMTYVNPQVLRSMGIRHFDSWAATFGRVATLIEQKPAGNGWQVRDRFLRFQNVPEMSRSFRMLADVRTDDDLPEIQAAKPKMTTQLVVSPKDVIDEALLKALEVRARAIEGGKEKKLWAKDSVIVLMGDLRRAMLDRRILNADLPENERSIVRLASENIYKTWLEHKDSKATQLVFCDQGIHAKGFSMFASIKDYLVLMGVPEAEIALAHEHTKPHERHRLQTRFLSGKIRVLMGSSTQIGLGQNLQRLCKAGHHIDMPMRPDMLKQRIGRFRRPGNTFRDAGVDNFVYAKEGQTRMFEILENKLIPFEQVLRNPDAADRRLEEELDVTMAEIQADLTDNPILREKVANDAELRNLDMLRRAHAREQSVAASLAQQHGSAAQDLARALSHVKEDSEAASSWYNSYRAKTAAAHAQIEAHKDAVRDAKATVRARMKEEREAVEAAERANRRKMLLDAANLADPTRFAGMEADLAEAKITDQQFINLCRGLLVRAKNQAAKAAPQGDSPLLPAEGDLGPAAADAVELDLDVSDAPTTPTAVSDVANSVLADEVVAKVREYLGSVRNVGSEMVAFQLYPAAFDGLNREIKDRVPSTTFDIEDMYRFFQKVPEARDRLPEMAQRGPGWQEFAAVWPRIESAYEARDGRAVYAHLVEAQIKARKIIEASGEQFFDPAVIKVGLGDVNRDIVIPPDLLAKIPPEFVGHPEDAGLEMRLGDRVYRSRDDAGFALRRYMDAVPLTDIALHDIGEIGEFKIAYRGPGALIFNKQSRIDFGDDAGSDNAPRKNSLLGQGTGFSDAWGEFVLTRGGSYTIKATGHGFNNILKMLAELRDMKETIGTKVAEHERHTSLAADYAERAADPFVQEDAWVRAQQEKARIDAEMLQHRGAMTVEEEERVMLPLMGVTLASGRPVHPAELKEWIEPVDVIEEAQEDEVVDEGAPVAAAPRAMAAPAEGAAPRRGRQGAPRGMAPG